MYELLICNPTIYLSITHCMPVCNLYSIHIPTDKLHQPPPIPLPLHTTTWRAITYTAWLPHTTDRYVHACVYNMYMFTSYLHILYTFYTILTRSKQEKRMEKAFLEGEKTLPTKGSQDVVLTTNWPMHNERWQWLTK